MPITIKINNADARRILKRLDDDDDTQLVPTFIRLRESIRDSLERL
jgi:hypothetical protein